MIDQFEFQRLADEGYNRIPLIAQTFADLETPLSVYLKLAFSQNGGRNSFLLESVVGGERVGRYSFIGLPARTQLRASGFGAQACTQVITDGQVVESQRGNPLDFIATYRQRFHVALPADLPRFCGGLAGYFGYDTVRHMEPKLAQGCPTDDLHLPDIVLLHTDEVAVIDNLSGKLFLLVYADPQQEHAYANAINRLNELRARLQNLAKAPEPIDGHTYAPVRHFAKSDYLKAVLKAKQMIAEGEVMQVQIGQRIERRFEQNPLSFYRALRSLNPSPYMYYYHFSNENKSDAAKTHEDDFFVIGSSPEILVQQETSPEGKKVTIRPLAGTRPRGATIKSDNAAETELINDPKERAEHVMLIDLARNDIGRVAKTASVKVTEAFAIERYSHVMHIVSNVEGVLKPNIDTFDVLKASFPAGTLTGAPKVRAMEIIDELEPLKRGVYGGACGHISYTDNMDVAIAIRTAIIKYKTLYVQASAGIVADSNPELEWLETEHKASALLRAAELAEQGLTP